VYLLKRRRNEKIITNQNRTPMYFKGQGPLL